jgi:DNA-binding transcriptional ArsR family regulator
LLLELGDTTRLRVLAAILGQRKNVSSIVSELGLSQPRVSYHLRKLREAGLAVEEKEGRRVWYQANREAEEPHIQELLELLGKWSGEGEVHVAGASSFAEVAPAVERASSAGDPPGVKRPRRRCPKGGGVMKKSKRRPVAVRRDGEGEGRPVVERPPRRDDEMEDFLL